MSARRWAISSTSMAASAQGEILVGLMIARTKAIEILDELGNFPGIGFVPIDEGNLNQKLGVARH